MHGLPVIHLLALLTEDYTSHIVGIMFMVYFLCIYLYLLFFHYCCILLNCLALDRLISITYRFAEEDNLLL